ncbi:MAG: glycosyltransferase, partial [Candidatus Omnitrophica bacterium]|nr:glycosyltransferase [Candidatus Omnitrophota bacterium]
MKKDENIICISSIDWDFIKQGHQIIMSRYARDGARVLFIENMGVRPPTFRDLPRLKKRLISWVKSVKGVRKVCDNLYVYSPLILPFPYSSVARLINRYLLTRFLDNWVRSMNFGEPIIWTFLPTWNAIDIVRHIDYKTLIYYCIDNFSTSSLSAKRIVKSEREMIKNADLVFTTSQQLYDYCKNYNSQVYKFPFGIDDNIFINQESPGNIPSDISHIKKPVAGYVGGIHKWVDMELIKACAQALPQFSFVFVGPIQRDISELRNLKNIFFLGTKRAETLPWYISSFDTAIIPYKVTPYTQNVYPTKMNEYLAIGKAVVSTHLPEVINFNKKNSCVISVCSSTQEFINALKKSVVAQSKDQIERRVEVAHRNTWSEKINSMDRLISQSIEKRKKD